MRTKSLNLIIIAGAVVLVTGGYLFLSSNTTDVQDSQELIGQADHTIVRTNDGYEPNELHIKQGEIVLWRNESDEYHWPASDLHPTHGAYPEFDPLRPIAPGEEWAFRFDQTGEWSFHDHIRANKIGVIYVTP